MLLLVGNRRAEDDERVREALEDVHEQARGRAGEGERHLGVGDVKVFLFIEVKLDNKSPNKVSSPFSFFPNL